MRRYRRAVSQATALAIDNATAAPVYLGMEPERHVKRSGVVQHLGPVEIPSRFAGTAVRSNEFGQPIGPEVTGWKPPPAPQFADLNGQYCHLQPLREETHGCSLFDAFAADARGVNWTYMPYGPFAQHPAAVPARGLGGFRIAQAVFGALAKPYPSGSRPRGAAASSG